MKLTYARLEVPVNIAGRSYPAIGANMGLCIEFDPASQCVLVEDGAHEITAIPVCRVLHMVLAEPCAQKPAEKLEESKPTAPVVPTLPAQKLPPKPLKQKK